MDRGAWWVTVHGVSKSRTQVTDFHFHLVVQWLRVHLALQGTQVQSLVRKIPHAVDKLNLCATTSELTL